MPAASAEPEAPTEAEPPVELDAPVETEPPRKLKFFRRPSFGGAVFIETAAGANPPLAWKAAT